MASKWNILQLGTKIRLKGTTSSKDDIDGIIKSYVPDENNVITAYLVEPIDSTILTMAMALDDNFEVLIPMSVRCPYCNESFQVEIESRYKGAKAIPQDGSNLDINVGENKPCPNPECERQLFIHWTD